VSASDHDGGGNGGGPTPPALVTSCVLGGVGGVALVAGLVTGSDALLGVAFAGGSLSLGAALVWRGQLIEDWHRRRG
jgi:hypothetical protein